jgi:hypothetical protein
MKNSLTIILCHFESQKSYLAHMAHDFGRNFQKFHQSRQIFTENPSSSVTVNNLYTVDKVSVALSLDDRTRKTVEFIRFDWIL